jgi:uncharacterized cupin superfamily protein
MPTVSNSASDRDRQAASTARTVDEDAIAANWRERGFSCALWVDAPGQVWADVVHDTDEIVMIVAGDVKFEIEGETHRPAPGEN